MLTGSTDDDTFGCEDECDQGITTTVMNSFGGALADVQCKLDYINYRNILSIESTYRYTIFLASFQFIVAQSPQNKSIIVGMWF